MKHTELLNTRTRREIACGEIRVLEEHDGRVIIGTIPYNRDSVPFLGFIEVISPGAWKRTLSEKAEVKALVNHNSGALLGSSTNGTLVLTDSEAGLSCRCILPKTGYAADLYEVISRGDVRTMSFGFIPRRYREEKERMYLEDGDLFEVSFGVSFPAYEGTNTVIERRLPMGKLVKREIDLEKLKDILNKEEALTEAELEEVKALISVLEEKAGIKQGAPGETSDLADPKEESWRSIAEGYGFKEGKQ